MRCRRSRVETDRLLLELAPSGFTRQAFCAQHGLSVVALDKYCNRRRALERQPAQPRPVMNQVLSVEFVSSIAPAQATVVGSCRTL